MFFIKVQQVFLIILSYLYFQWQLEFFILIHEISAMLLLDFILWLQYIYFSYMNFIIKFLQLKYIVLFCAREHSSTVLLIKGNIPVARPASGRVWWCPLAHLSIICGNVGPSFPVRIWLVWHLEWIRSSQIPFLFMEWYEI